MKQGLEVALKVALLAEGVDRNKNRPVLQVARAEVALLAEGVDRNLSALRVTSGPSVALLAEGVDRNGLSLV